MPKGIFPNMNIQDIITALSGWGLPVRAEQLTHPTAEFVEGVYCACLQQVTGVTFESLREPVASSISSLEIDSEQDLYSTAFSHNLILYHLTRFAKAAQVEDFTSKDLFAPEKARTLVLLSAFINYVKFTEQFCDQHVKERREHSEKVIVEREEVLEELEKILQEIGAIKTKLAEDGPQCEALKRENDILRANMFEIKNSQGQLTSELDRFKGEKDTLVRQRESISEEIANTNDAVQRMQGRIVQSPDRIKKRISQMTLDAAEEKRNITANETKARELQAKVNALVIIEKDMRSCIEQLHTVMREVHSLQDTLQSLNDTKVQLEDRSIERSELMSKHERVHKQVTNAHEKLERAQKHAEDRKQTNEKTILKLKAEYEKMAIERRDNDKQLEELRMEATSIQTKMADHLKQSEAELNELLSEYWIIRYEADVYMETLANKLNMQIALG